MRAGFHEATLCLLGVFRLCDVDPNVEEATASAIGAVFRKHLRKCAWAGATESLTTLLSELEEPGGKET